MTQSTIEQDPFGATVDETGAVLDPFATEEEAVAHGGGKREPAPFPSALDGCFIALVPRAFTSRHKVHPDYVKEKGATEYQDRYNADIILLGTPDGGPFTFNAPDPDFTGEGKAPLREFTVTPEEMPKMWPGRFILEYAIIGQLRNALKAGKYIVTGTMRRGPQAEDARKGATFDSVAADFAKHFATNGRHPKPRFSWQIDTRITPEQIAARGAWYASVKDTINLGAIKDLDAGADQK